MAYLDTSCLLKLFFTEPEQAQTIDLLGREDVVVVSGLARLEALVQLQARVAGGVLRMPDARRLSHYMDVVLRHEPFRLVPCPADVVGEAERQVAHAAAKAHCRTLDRLHLAAMQLLGETRLVTADSRQAAAARRLGFTVLMPA